MRKFLFPLLVITLIFGFQPVQIGAQLGEGQILYEGEINSLAWSPDGKFLVMQGINIVNIYAVDSETSTQKENIVTLSQLGIPDTTNQAIGIAWKPEGLAFAMPYLDTEGTSGISLRVWSIETLETRDLYDRPFNVSAIISLSWSSDSQKLAMATATGQVSEQQGTWSIAIHDLTNADFYRTITMLGQNSVPINAIDWSTDSIHLASGLADGYVEIWDTGNAITEIELSPAYRYEGHTGAVNAVVWNPSGTLLASASDDATIRIWDFATGETVMILEGHEGAVNAIDWNADGTLIASAGDDATVRIWDVATGENILTLEGHEDSIHALDWSPDDSKIATASRDDTVRLWQIELGE